MMHSVFPIIDRIGNKKENERKYGNKKEIK
jgi:hypothetical protein